MFEIINRMLIALLSICTIGKFCESLAFNSTRPIKRVSLNNQPCKARPTLTDVNSNETNFYPFNVSVNDSGGSCNTINDPYARVCVPDKVKSMNVNVFNLMSRINETRFLVQHELHECACGLNESGCNSKEKWNHDECLCKCKELEDWSSCKVTYMWGSIYVTASVIRHAKLANI